MPELRVDLEAITPLFLAGANGTTPELRPASFRGVLRFWLRAMLGGVYGDDLKTIKAVEATIFGSTEAASSITIRTRRLLSRHTEQLDVPAPKRGETDRSYLFYGLESRYKEEGMWRLRYRPSVKPGSPIVVTIGTRPGISGADPVLGDATSMELACAAFWLMTRLGAIGARSRRGAGALDVRNTPSNWPPRIPAMQCQAMNPDSLKDELQQGLCQLQALLPQRKAATRLPSFDVIHPDWCKIYVANQCWNGWEDALDDLASTMAEFRNHHQPDYKTVRAAAHGDGSTVQVERAAFGLPIPFFFSSTHRRAVVRGAQHDRRASPLFIRVTRFAGQSGYGIVLLLFRAVLLPENNLHVARGRETLATGPVPNLTLIEKFLQEVGDPRSQYHLAPLLEVEYK